MNQIILNEQTAYLSGMIVGDGHLSNSVKSKRNDASRDYRITLDIVDREHLFLVFRIIKGLIQTKSEPKEVNQGGNRIRRYCFQFRNKDLFLFFHEELGIPKGAKSSVVSVPLKIKFSGEEIRRNFLAGYFDADGGFRGNTLGFTTASKNLNEDIAEMLGDFSFSFTKESWVNKKYGKTFFGIRLRRSEIDRFLNNFPLRNKEKLERINKRFKIQV